MIRKNVALIGYRCTGKSTVGVLLAEELGCDFVDMDTELVASFGMDIDSWVRQHGWDSFREAEAGLLLSLSGRTGTVLATGGGVVLRESNRTLLKENFFVVWLRSSPEVIYERLISDPQSGSMRPALTGLSVREEVERLLFERSPLYEQTADLVVETDHTPPAGVVEKIRRSLLASPPRR